MNSLSPNVKCHRGYVAHDIVTAFASLFRGRTDAWGALTGNCIKEAVTTSHYRRHLEGKVSHGTYPLLNDGTCYWVAADLDQLRTSPWHNGPDDARPALAVMENLTRCGVNQGIFLEKTKSKGWRPWLFFSDAVAAADARRLFITATEKAGLPSSIEIFPKQNTPDGIRFGNYVHLPYFGGGPSGDRPGRVMVNPADLSTLTLTDLLKNAQPFPAGEVPHLLERLPRRQHAGSRGRSPDDVVAVLTRPLEIGERRPTLVSMAGYLRSRGIAEDVAVALLIPWAERRFVEPLPPHEVETHIRGIYQRYGSRSPGIDEAQLVKEIPNEIQEMWK